MFTLFLVSETKFITRGLINDTFIKRVTEEQWRSIEKQTGNKFLIFHADSDRVSDIAYLRFVDIASKFKSIAKFYVTHALDSQDLAHEYKIRGYPSLYYVRNSQNIFEMPGAFSNLNVLRFIQNMTFSGFSEVPNELVESCSDISCIAKATQVDEFDLSARLLIFGDNSTRFGRTALDFSYKIKSQMPIFRISSAEVCKKLRIRFPSLIYLRISDLETFTYIGEPKLESMESWFKEIPSPSVKLLKSPELFDFLIRSQKKTVVGFAPKESYNTIIPKLTPLASKFPKLKFRYADPTIFKGLIQLTHWEKNDQFLCLGVNSSLFSFAPCGEKEIELFDRSALEMETIITPSGLFDYFGQTSGVTFERVNKIEDCFVAFYSTNLASSYDYYEVAERAAKIYGELGGQTHWYSWNVRGDPPNFKDDMKLEIPSIAYFPQNGVDLNQSIIYKGKMNEFQVIDWARNINNKNYTSNIMNSSNEEAKQ